MIDFSNNTTKTILDETADLVLQQIDLLLDTDKGEVLGEQDFGTDYDKFLYEINVGNNYIIDYIERNIENNVDFPAPLWPKIATISPDLPYTLISLIVKSHLGSYFLYKLLTSNKVSFSSSTTSIFFFCKILFIKNLASF